MQARYEFRIYCEKCGATTVQCTWLIDARKLWEHGDTKQDNQ